LYVELLSLFTAICYGASAVFTRKGMSDSNPITGAVVTALIQVVVLLGLLLTYPPVRIDLAAIAFFVASGILASTLGRLLNFMSIERLGVPVSASIIGSSPLFSTLFAVIAIGESVAMTTALGTVFVVVGIALTSGGNKPSSRLVGSTLVLPVMSAAFYGASSVVRKVGLNILPDSVLGAFVGAASSLVSFLLYIVTTNRVAEVRLSRNSVKYFVGSGFAMSAGWLTMFAALSTGSVSVVSALIGTNPLFSLALSIVFLREAEDINRRIAAGSFAIVAGAAIITLF
jgi:DME family drug/metabolite transporter